MEHMCAVELQTGALVYYIMALDAKMSYLWCMVHCILVELQTEFQRLYGSDSVHEGYRKKEIEFTKLGGLDF